MTHPWVKDFGNRQLLRHFQVIGGPVFHVPVFGNRPKHPDKSIASQMHLPAFLGYRHGGQGQVPRSLGVHPPVGPQLAQPEPSLIPDGFQILQAGIPTVEEHPTGLKAPPLRHLQHPPEVAVLGQSAQGTVIDPEIAGYQRIAISPQQGQQVDAPYHSLMLAAPMPELQCRSSNAGTPVPSAWRRACPGWCRPAPAPPPPVAPIPGFPATAPPCRGLSPQQTGECVMGWSLR